MRRLVVFTALLILSACGGRKASVPIPTTGATVAPPDLEGLTPPTTPSRTQGRPTANGEIFDSYKAMTAAHRTLPFNTLVRVTNKANGETVDVRINDRGPFVDARVIALSVAAARKIDMVRYGVVPV